MPTITSDTPRRWKRQPTKTPIRLVLRARDLKVDSAATIIDISLGGMGVKSALAPVPGEWVGVIAKGEFRDAIPTRAVWVRQDESSHWTFAGLEFLNTSGA